MNKLVSRNPIQRFKQGRKIVKAQEGVKTNRRTPGGQIIYDTQKQYNPFAQLWNYLTTPQTSGITPGGKKYQSNSNITKNPQDYSWMKGGTRKRTPEEQQKWEAENQRQQNLLKNDARISSKVSQPKQQINNIWIKGYNRRPEITNVKSMQNQLIKLGLLKDKFGADGKWGKNTEEAYQKYLRLKNIPTIERPTNLPSPAAQAGIYSEETKPLYQKISFKNGGNLLPSRNIIERFKQKRNNY